MKPRPTERNAAGIALSALRAAPRLVQIFLACWLVFIVTDAVLETRHWLAGTGPLAVGRYLGVVLGHVGLLVLMSTLLLLSVSQNGGQLCSSRGLGLKWRQADLMVRACPMLAHVAGALLALAVGLQLPVALERPHRFALIGSLGFCSLYAVYVVSSASRFLYRHAAEQAERAARAQEEATEAQLQALQAQMNPHFLFNALNTVASLVRTDAPAAERTVESLAQILRRTLDRSRQSLCSVSDEVDYLRAYLQIEQERFGERLHVQWDVEPQALEAQIPPMTLQPLVENALKHAIGMRLRGGTLRIVAALDGGRRLRLEVHDDGEGFPERFEEGTGLGNLRERLQTLYGDEARLEVASALTGSRVCVELPAAAGARA